MSCLTGAEETFSDCDGDPAPGARYCIKHYAVELERVWKYQRDLHTQIDELRIKLDTTNLELARLLKEGASYFKEVPPPEPSP